MKLSNRRTFLAALVAMSVAPQKAVAAIATGQQSFLTTQLKNHGIPMSDGDFTIECWIRPVAGTEIARRLAGRMIPGHYHHAASVVKDDTCTHYIDGKVQETDSLTDAVFAEIHLIALGAKTTDIRVHESVDSFRYTSAARTIEQHEHP